jgi:putative ubiquitin-RnfH superfamily antitoxin RatB of RatAB toxin-antitoxin module
MTEKIKIEVAYARPDLQKILSISVPVGTSVYEAAQVSGINKIFPEIDFTSIDMGIFGKVVKDPGTQEVREGDRIELYRPLLIDPKQARLNRAGSK